MLFIAVLLIRHRYMEKNTESLGYNPLPLIVSTTDEQSIKDGFDELEGEKTKPAGPPSDTITSTQSTPAKTVVVTEETTVTTTQQPVAVMPPGPKEPVGWIKVESKKSGKVRYVAAKGGAGLTSTNWQNLEGFALNTVWALKVQKEKESSETKMLYLVTPDMKTFQVKDSVGVWGPITADLAFKHLRGAVEMGVFPYQGHPVTAEISFTPERKPGRENDTAPFPAPPEECDIASLP